MPMLPSIRALARRQIESLYEDTCTIYGYSPEVNQETGATEPAETILAEDIPCRISFSSGSTPVNSDYTPDMAQQVKLFLSPDVDVPAGCRIAVNRGGIVTDYVRSGQPAMYPGSHQEIALELWRARA